MLPFRGYDSGARGQDTIEPLMISFTQKRMQ
jgi:hypothetical protein